MYISEKLRRLGEMSAREIKFRMAQKLRTIREQCQLAVDGNHFSETSWWLYWEPEQIADRELRYAVELGDGPRAAALLPDYFRTRRTTCFYWPTTEKTSLVALYKSEFPRRAEGIVQEAEAICAHRFRIFAYPEILCGARIPWRQDLVHGVESGLEHFARQPILNMNRVGDTKIVWEINRHQHFLTLSIAYLLTGEERFAEECLTQWEDWTKQNPYLCGINWASSLEVAFRCWAWIWTFYLLLGSRSLSGERIARLTQKLSLSASFIVNNLSLYFAPNTHLLGEGFSLFVVGLLFPELKGAAGWREHGQRILCSEMQKQVREDGSHFEQSLFYHRYAVEFFLCAAILANANNITFPDSYNARMEKMLEFLIHTAWPNGAHPSVGDSDGGRLIPFGAFEAEDHRPVLSTGAVYFSHGEFSKAAGGFHEQTLWLLGAKSVQKQKSLPKSLPNETSRMFPEAGVVAMRSDWTERAKFMLFDAGPQGIGASAHGHGDSLSVLCAANGVEWLIDPGTYVYSSSRQWRDFFRSASAHNTIVIDGVDHAEQVDWFKWRKLPEVRLEKEFMHPVVDFAVGTHTGYARLPQPVKHCRKVVFVKPDYWLISDELIGDGKHLISVFFHFAPDVSIQPHGQGWLATKGRESFLLLPFGSTLEFRTVRGESSPIQGWSSSDYGHQEPTSVLIGEAEAQLPQRFQWLLFPISSDDQLPEVIESSDKTFSLSVTMPEWTDSLALNMKSEGEPGMDFAIDAELKVERKDSSGRLKRLVLLGGRSFSGHEIEVFPADKNFDHFIADWTETGLRIDANPLPEFQVRSDHLRNLVINGEPRNTCADMGSMILKGEN
jgi:hypothetical protein